MLWCRLKLKGGESLCFLLRHHKGSQALLVPLLSSHTAERAPLSALVRFPSPVWGHRLPPLYLSCASGMECTNSCAFAHSTTRAPFTEVRRRMAHRPTVASWAPFCISYPVFAMLESMRDFLELVALRFFSHLGEEPLENHFSILRKKTAQGL